MKKNISDEIEKIIESLCLETVGEDGLGIYDLHGLRDVIEHTFYLLYRSDKINYCIKDIEGNSFQNIKKIRKAVENIVNTEIKKARESRLAYCPHCHRMVNGQNSIKTK